MTVLEIIVTSGADALAAQKGGADRVEVVSAMDQDGLTPTAEFVARLGDAVTLPLRVMLRRRRGFQLEAHELDGLRADAERLRAAGASEFVFGFGHHDRRLDCKAMLSLQEAASPVGWTLHRAFDHVADAPTGFTECARLPALDAILSSGHPSGLDTGLAMLIGRAGWETERLRFIAGGGLCRGHVAPLVAAGITQLHAGRAVRRGGSWNALVDEQLVRELRETIDRVAAR